MNRKNFLLFLVFFNFWSFAQGADSISVPSNDGRLVTNETVLSKVEKPQFSPVASWPNLMSQIVIFLIVLALGFYGFVRFGKRFGLAGFDKAGTKNDLKILEIRSLGNRQHLVVVAYEEQRILLAVTPNGIEHLCSLGHGKKFGIPSRNMLAGAEKRYNPKRQK